jgi:predicted PurR-regulated permease PerM
MTERDTMSKTALVLLATLACLAAAAIGRPVLAPVAAGLMIVALVWPLHHRMIARLPAAVAIVLSMLAAILTLIVGMVLVIWAFSTISRDLAANVGAYQAAIAALDRWLEGHGLNFDAIWAGVLSPAWLIRQAQWIAGQVNSAMTFLVIALIYTLLALVEVPVVQSKLSRSAAGSAPAIALAALGEAAGKVRTYMVVRSWMSLATGLLVGLLAWGFGLGNPVQIGIIAFVLNYIPFVGSFIATLVPTALAIIQLQSWVGVLAIFAGLNIVQSIVGSYVEPRLAGSAVSLSPALVLFSVFFGMFIWGVFGAFVGTPFAIVALTVCEHVPSARWLARLCDGRRDAEGSVPP